MPAVSFGYNNALFQRVLAVTTDNFEKKGVDNIMAKKEIFAVMKSKGCIRKISGGTQNTRHSRYKRATLRGLPMDIASISYQRLSKRINFAIPPRGQETTDAITIQERFINQGPQAFVNLYGTLLKELMDDATFDFPKQFFKDGNASGNTDGIHGWESALSHSGTIGNGMLGAPNDTYFGVSTAVGLRGSWDASNTYPNGAGQVGYHHFSPFIWIYDDTGIGSGSTWEDNSLKAMKKDALFSSRRGHKRDFGILNTNAYNAASNKIEAREAIRTDRSNKNIPSISLGFGEEFTYEGVRWTHDSDVPDRNPLALTSHILAGYSFTVEDLDLMHWTDKLFHVPQIPFSGETLSDRLLVMLICNLFVNPQGVSKFIKSDTSDITISG